MSGLARTVDKVEETARQKPYIGLDATPGVVKRQYGKKRGVNTADKGYYEGKEEKLTREADEAAAAAIAALPKPTPIPGRDTDLERAQRRRRYSRQSRGGRLSTILSDDTLG